MVSRLLGHWETLFYSMVLMGREDYLLWIVTRETCIQIVSHVTLEIIYGQKKINKNWLHRNKEKIYFPLLENVLTKTEQISISPQTLQAWEVRNLSERSQLCFLFFKLHDKGDRVFTILETVTLRQISIGLSDEKELWTQPSSWSAWRLLGL